MTDPAKCGGWSQEGEDLKSRNNVTVHKSVVSYSIPCTFNAALFESTSVIEPPPSSTIALHCTTVLLYCGVAGMISLAGESPDGGSLVKSGGN